MTLATTDKLLRAAVVGACLLAAAGAHAAADTAGNDKDAVTMQDPKARDDIDRQRSANSARSGRTLKQRMGAGKGMKKDPAAAGEETKR